MFDVADVLMRYELENKLVDVPSQLQHGKRRMPLDAYLKKKLRRMIGRDEKTPQEVLDLQEEKLQDVREGAFMASQSFSEEIAKKGLQRSRQIEHQIKRQRKKHI